MNKGRKEGKQGIYEIVTTLSNVHY